MSPFVRYGLHVRLVDASDAAFIHDLRRDEKLSRYLSGSGESVERQREWIDRYKERERKGEEYYFIYTDREGNRLGVNRLYNLEAESFEVGSWVFRRGLPMESPILGDLVARDFGFETLQYPYCRLEVMKDNKSSIRYQEGFRPERVGMDDRACYFRLSREAYILHRNKLLKILHHG